MVHWNVAPRHDETDPDAIAQFALARAKTGSIVILHDELFDVQHSEAVGFAAAKSLPLFVPKLASQGAQFRSLSEQLN